MTWGTKLCTMFGDPFWLMSTTSKILSKIIQKLWKITLIWLCHALTLEILYSLFWVRSGCDYGGHPSFVISMLAWYGSQSEAAVYRCLWLGIIFKQPFPTCLLWDLVFWLVACEHAISITFRYSLLFLWVSSNEHLELYVRFALVHSFQRLWQCSSSSSLLRYVVKTISSTDKHYQDFIWVKLPPSYSKM